MGFRLFCFLTFFLVVAVSHASLPSEVYWKLALPYTPIPKSVRDLLHPKDGGANDVSKIVLSAVPKDTFVTYTPDAADTLNVDVSKIVVTAIPDTFVKYAPTAVDTPNVDVSDIVVTAIPDTFVKYAPDSVDTPNVDVSKIVVTAIPDTFVKYATDSVDTPNVDVSKIVVTAIPDTFVKYAPTTADTISEDQSQETSKKGYFLQEDLYSTKKMKMHFRKSTNMATFLPRQVANSIPFSSDKLLEILNRFSLKQDSEAAEIMKDTIQVCEKPALEGDSKLCATSLESLIDFSISQLGKNMKVLSNNVEMGSQEYELGEGVKVVADKSVVCHKQRYPYAVFYCHAIHKTKVYTLPFVGTQDGTKVEVVASCHMDTSAWNPKHAAFHVLKVKPGTVPVCHFLPQDDLIWIPK